MSLLHAFVLGMVQGLGEFLPISSSAHLVITPWLFHWDDPGLGFDVALHWGTLVAVLFYFRNDVWLLVRGFYHSLLPSTRDRENIYQKLSWLIIIASIPGAIIGKLLESKVETVFRDPLLIAITMSSFAVVLLFADWYGKKQNNLNHVTAKNALCIGFAQAIAVIPGVSRSGATMAAALGLGFKREDAARFSFLMSIPIIFGAGLLKVRHFHDGVTTPELIVGFLSAVIFGFLSIKFLLRYISKHNYTLFVWYRILFAGLIVAVYFLRK